MTEVEIPHNVVNGIVFPSFITQQRLDELRDFPLKPDDLFIPPYPKSGTTWLQQIVKLIVRFVLHIIRVSPNFMFADATFILSVDIG